MFKAIFVGVCTFGMGFLAAIPVGATQLEIARRSVKGYLPSAFMIIVGSVLSDTMYGAIAYWGIAPFLEKPDVVAAFWLAGAIISIGLGIWAIRDGQLQKEIHAQTEITLRKRSVGFATGFSLAVTNPLMIVWWLFGAQILKHIGMLETLNSSMKILLLTAGSTGIASYLIVFTLGIFKAKRFVSENGMKKVSTILGVILIGFALFFIVRSFIVLSGDSGSQKILPF